MKPETEFLGSPFDLTSDELLGVLDEVSLWSAMAGLLLLENIPLRRNIRALDVACGFGFPMLELAQRLGEGSEVAGIDLWQKALDRAGHKARVLGIKNIEIVAGSAEKMPWEDGRFDLITSNLGVNNFEDPAKLLQECFRVAKPGATIALTSNLRGHMREFYEVFEEVLREMKNTEALNRLRAHIDHRTTVPALADLLNQCGFSPGKSITRKFPFRYASGSAMLRHTFIRLAFLEAWQKVLDPPDQRPAFQLLLERLDKLASIRGELVLTVPFAYIEGTKP